MKELSSHRRWLWRLTALIVVPLLLLGGVEMLLRLAGYGYSTGFFQKIHHGGKDYLVNNPDFSLRFFPPQLARWPGPVMMEAQKPAGTYRIFILGESAARGEPEPACAASRYLEQLLGERYPKIRFEVVNLGITAINSHVILPLARDCAQAGGDLWIIYMGNNEMVGPFGAATVFGAKAPPAGFVRLNLAIQRLRLGQLLVGVARKLTPANANESWGGMKMFVGNQLRPEDPRRATVDRNFEQNLDDIVRAGLDSGAKILLNTVAVNLKDCPPFASMANGSLPAADRRQFDTLYAAACSNQSQNNFNQAAGEFENAARIDPGFSELQYHWAQCLLAVTNLAAARAHFQAACDSDALPFRADSHINAAIREAARKFAGGNLVFVDAASGSDAAASSGVCGKETFYEHVHFNFDGNFRLGFAWAQQVEKILPANLVKDVPTNAWLPQETCDLRLALTDWNRGAVTGMMINRLQLPPLSSQPNNLGRLEELRDQSRKYHQKITSTTSHDAVEIYSKAINRRPDDHWLHQNFAEFLESTGDLKAAVAQWRQIRELLPREYESFYQAGRLSSKLEQWDDARTDLSNAILLRPGFPEGWYELGGVHLATCKFEDALQDYNQALRLDPRNATYLAYTGKALSKLNRDEEAVKLYRQAVQKQPGLWEAHFALADELSAAGNLSEAEQEYRQVVELRPKLSVAHLNHGVILARLGNFDASLVEIQETLRLEPQNQQARQTLDQIKNLKNSHRQ